MFLLLFSNVLSASHDHSDQFYLWLIWGISIRISIWVFPDRAHSDSVNRAALISAALMLCSVRTGAMGRAGVEFPDPARPKETTWLCLECLCLSSVSSFTCAIGVTTILLLMPPGTISNTAAQEHGQSVTCGFYLLSPFWNVEAYFYFGMMSCWTKVHLFSNLNGKANS